MHISKKDKKEKKIMIGAIAGDIIGSLYEWNNIKSKEFDLFNPHSFFTDDTVMTIAVGLALTECKGKYDKLSERVIEYMKMLGQKHPHAGYGGHFGMWLISADPQPYNSYGNGAAMRISPVAYFADTIDDVKKLSYAVTSVSHNHPEGIKGAEATAVAIFLALQGKTKEEIKDYIVKNYYPLEFTLDEIRPTYTFDVSCQGSVPQALEAFFESNDFEDAIRNAISIGGDSDTIAAITGGIAEAYYGVSDEIKHFVGEKLGAALRMCLAKTEKAISRRSKLNE